MRLTVIQILIVIFSCCCFFNNILAQDIHLKGIPYSLTEYNSSINIEVKYDSVVTITAPGKTNLFNNPSGSHNKQDASMLLFYPDSNFVFKAKIKADLKEVYDVAALVLYQNKELWAKLCYEYSAEKKATVVSVVTKKYSDDCNSVEIPGNYIYYAIVKKGDEFSFHYSIDNVNWHLVRHFRMKFNNDLRVGFAVHCSKSDLFSAEFSDVKYSAVERTKMRSLSNF
jgi:regulation of enolase protein 1 (concanavalin A-like superfamily)